MLKYILANFLFYSKSSQTYTNVDEVRKSMQATYAMITNFRGILEEGLNELYDSIETFSVDQDDDTLEETAELTGIVGRIWQAGTDHWYGTT